MIGMRVTTLPPCVDNALDAAAPDPLRYGFPLPLIRVFYPMGYAVEIVTNSPETVRAAEDVWGACTRFHQTSPIRVRLAVDGSAAIDRSTYPVFRGQAHLVSITAGADNFAVADLCRGFIYGWFTDNAVDDHAWFRYHFLEPLVYLALGSLYCTPVHAACVSLDERAILLCGDSGAGKTCLAYACAKRGWTYIADDASYLVRGEDDLVMGRPDYIRFRDSAALLFPELSVHPTVVRPNGKSDIEVESHMLGLTTARSARVGCIVFLKRSGGTRPAIEPYLKFDAMSHFGQVICYGDDDNRAEHLRQLRRLTRLPAFELNYSELDGSVGCLRSLVQRVSMA